MHKIIKWTMDNLNWIFDGVGVAILGGLIGFIFKKRHDSNKSIKIIQKGGKKSVNIQKNNIGSDKNE